MFSSNRPRREHYVPRVYLEHFGTSLTGFDKRTGNVFTTTSKNVAFEEGFYDLDPNIDLEGLIAKNERSLMSGIRELIEKSNPTAISSESRAKVSLFVSLQFVRTREYREEIKETGGKFLTEIVNSEPRFKGFDFKVVMKEELAQALQAQAIVDDTVPKTAWFLGNSRWTLLVNRSKVPFWTSDNPVTLFNPVDYGEAGGLGFNVRGIQTHFPLNSSLLLLILDPTSYDMPPIKIVKEDNVDWENELQLYNATRFVFSPARDFSKAKKMWEKDENLRKPHDRIVIHTSEGPRSSFIRTTRNRTHHPT